jgi:inner membrane protein
VAAIFFILELAAPGAFMLWLGLAATLVGVLSLAVTWAWQAQLVAFAVLAIALVPAWRRYAAKVEVDERPFLNRRAHTYIGRVFTLDKPIENGHGTVRVDDTVWRVRGPDSPAGSRIKVTEADGATLVVEPVTG